MKILTLGGTRYVELIKQLRLQDPKLDISTLSKHALNDPGIKHFVSNGKDLNSLKKIIAAVNPTIIIDMICFDRNDATGIIELDATGDLKGVSHYIMISSFFVYNYFTGRECKYDGNVEIVQDGYTKRKIEAECILYNSRIFERTSIVRFPYVFSCDDYTGRFQKFCYISHKLPLEHFNNIYPLAMISKYDAAKSLAGLCCTNPVGIVDIANTGCLTLRDLSHLAHNAKLKQVSALESSENLHPYPVDRNLCLKTEKIKPLRDLNVAFLDEVQKLSEMQSKKG